ncbi:ABC transporter permease subunit [Brenneria corticis]|uniref:Branched-chain amino acid ABC transporter permease LivH n=1 Tax=Brenneria corticis TaxID=2173106 RepID=A0A2U1UCU1_9GAMM|nr:branched-chain amino acid ABC transporter permease LivH [Brenneria sp. CFCC 11842]PWC19496.1 branched-chain amino acid ABC transporter permease LivH [Brenneria sp. CFCC 11842]
MDLHIFIQQLVNGLVLGAIYGLIAVGYTMVYGVIGMINFAHGDVYMVSAYVTAIALSVCAYFGISSVLPMLLITLAAVVLVTGTYGWVIERVAYRPLQQSTRLAPLISAIGVSLFLQSYVQLSQGPNLQGIPTILKGAFVLPLGAEPGNSVQITYPQALIILVSAASMALLTWIIAKTPLGRSCRATQQDPRMAVLLGINTRYIISLVFVIGAVMAAIAGLLVTLNYGSFDFSIGFVIGIKAFTAAVLGGIGSLPGALLGGLLLGLLESVFAGFVSSDYKDVFAFSVLIIVLVFKPSGLFGKPAVEKV